MSKKIKKPIALKWVKQTDAEFKQYWNRKTGKWEAKRMPKSFWAIEKA